MQIKSITISNFRSYYQTSIFDIGKGLTLIIGDNGDGKTTFFEALEWLFDASFILPKADKKFISKKRIAQMLPGESDTVRVSMEFEHCGQQNTLERSFVFAIELDGNVCTSNFNYVLYSQDGSERRSKEGSEFECLFDTAIRRYCLFKGESELNIFNRPETINLMVDTFSELKNFTPYVDFSGYAVKHSERAKENALALDKKNARKAKDLKVHIDNIQSDIDNLERELHQKQLESTNFTNLLENLEQNKEAASQLKDINDRIERLMQKKEQLIKCIHEDYTIRLLDDMWVLCGFAPIAQSYTEKVNALSKERRRQEIAFHREQGAHHAIKHIQETLQNGAPPLPVYVPSEQQMREMLDDHICKVCNREAPEGSDAYNFMKKRLDAYLESLELHADSESDVQLFVQDYITELDKRGTVLHNEMPFFVQLPDNIREEIDNITSKKNEMQRLEANIASAEDDKKKILAQTQGITEEQLQVAYANISNWFNLKSDAEKRIGQIEELLIQHKEDLSSVQSEYDKVSLSSSARNYANVNMVFRKINEAFMSARQQNKRNFLDALEKCANRYLAKLNVEDFTGEIRLVENPDSSAMIELKSSNDDRIINPNTALKTTMYMSILFAVSELTTLKRDSDYPLIFDAPTSSFAGAKESDFFKVISSVDKQTIIVTKSFLREDNNGRNEIDMTKVKDISGVVYRLAKSRPFHQLDLTTIHTTVHKIK